MTSVNSTSPDFASGQSNEPVFVVCPALGSTHTFSEKHIFPIGLTNQDIVQEMPMPGPGVHPGGFQLIPLLEYGVCNKQIELGMC